jgi:aminoglycoside phosphotransferase family enzyme/predicted kinase
LPKPSKRLKSFKKQTHNKKTPGTITNSSTQNNSILNFLQILLKPKFWGRDVKKVNLIQTHTSWVFLTGKYAYKIKKPVFFGFLDYTTLSARQYFCQEEFRINQILAPDIYYEVISIVKKGSKIKLSAKKNNQEVLDYAIKMRELPQETIMTHCLKTNKVNYSDIEEIARIIANFHNKSTSKPEFHKYGTNEIIKYNWDENFAQTEPFIGITISKKSFAEIRQRVEDFMINSEVIFQKRIRDAKIKQCHGDLHSRNIFITDSPRTYPLKVKLSDKKVKSKQNVLEDRCGARVYIFDCLEFNPRFAVSDVASEIAFFVMDLEFYKHKELADFFIARYLHYTNDWELLKVLDFYKCYRAYVRGKVTGFNLNDRGMSKSDKNQAKVMAKEYFSLAEKYALSLTSKPKLIMVMGLPAVGKTYLAQHLADHIHAYHLCSDIIRKEITNTPVETHCFEGYGKGIYTKEVSAKTYDEMFRRAENYLTQGKTIIIDATFSWQSSRNLAKTIADKTHASFYIINCTCPEKVVMARMKKREKEFSLSDATPEIYYRMLNNFEKVKSKKNYLEVDTSKPIRTNLSKISHWLKYS